MFSLESRLPFRSARPLIRTGVSSECAPNIPRNWIRTCARDHENLLPELRSRFIRNSATVT